MIKILIVDDEEISRNVAENCFEKYGDCHFAETSEEALLAFQEAIENESHFDLVILDYALDAKTGLDVLMEFRLMEKTKEVFQEDLACIIMLTGNRELKVVKACIAAGCNEYIVKPLLPEKVDEKLSKLGIIS